MFSQGSVTEAMMEAKKLQCPLVLFVVDEESAADVIEWAICGSFASTAVMQLIREGSEEHMQLDAIVPERMIPRAHVIPPSASGLPPSCVYDKGFNYRTLSDIIISAGLWEDDNVFGGWASSVEETCKAMEDEAAQWKRSQRPENVNKNKEVDTRESRITVKFYPNFTRGTEETYSSSSSSSSAVVQVVARPLLWKTATELVGQFLGEQVNKILLKAKKNGISVSDEDICAAKKVKDGVFYIESGRNRANTEEDSQNLHLITGSVVNVIINNDVFSKEDLIPSYVAAMTLKKEEKESVISSSSSAQSPIAVHDKNYIDKNCTDPPSSEDAPAQPKSTGEEPKKEENLPSSIIRFTGHNGDPIEWIIHDPHVLTLGALRQRVSDEILQGRPTSTFALVVAYPPKRLQPSEDGATLASLNLQGKRALRIVLEGDWNTNPPAAKEPPVRALLPEAIAGGMRSMVSAAFNRIGGVTGGLRPASAGSTIGSSGGRTIGTVHSTSSSSGGGRPGPRINTMAQILAQREEEEKDLARRQAAAGKKKANVYYGGDSTEYQGKPDDDDNKNGGKKK